MKLRPPVLNNVLYQRRSEAPKEGRRSEKLLIFATRSLPYFLRQHWRVYNGVGLLYLYVPTPSLSSLLIHCCIMSIFFYTRIIDLTVHRCLYGTFNNQLCPNYTNAKTACKRYALYWLIHFHLAQSDLHRSISDIITPMAIHPPPSPPPFSLCPTHIVEDVDMVWRGISMFHFCSWELNCQLIFKTAPAVLGSLIVVGWVLTPAASVNWYEFYVSRSKMPTRVFLKQDGKPI